MAHCAQCKANINSDFVIVPYSPDLRQSRAVPHSSIERDARILELTTQDKDTKSFCETCNKQIAGRLDELISELDAEKQRYSEFLAQLKQKKHALRKSTPIYTEKDEMDALEELRIAENDREQMWKQFYMLKQEKMKFQQEEEAYWRELNTLGGQLENIEESTSFWLECSSSLQAELDHLNNINVYADAFQVSVVQGIGSINNLKLGRLPEVPVEWDEINAAWSQTALLLYSLSKKLSCSFSKYRVVPLGFHPTIHHKDTRISYPLYGSNSITFGRSFFWTASSSVELDAGMEAFLFCVSELCARALSLSPTFSLPF